MARAYTPGLLVTKQVRVEKLRELPLPGRSLVSVGDSVRSRDPVLEAELPGDLDIIRVAERMGFDPEDVVGGMRVTTGDRVEEGQLICERSTLFGLLSSRLHAPRGGVVEFFTESNAHLGIRQPPERITVDAYLSGWVTAVEEGKSVTIEADAAVIQGIFGVGGERHGSVLALDCAADHVVDQALLESLGDAIHGTVLIGGARFTFDALQFAATRGAVGIVTGSIDSQTLRNYVGYEIGVSITGDEPVPCTVIVTEGFGFLPIAERIRALAGELHGKACAVNGATQVRAGAMRPEVIVPREGTDRTDQTPERAAAALEVGRKIRIIRVPYFGMLAEVVELPGEPRKIPTGAKVRVLLARLENGQTITVPRANVELLE
ncbi:MAG: hypothetical protein KDD44_02335 [Bdellovibrionales bacterium]|nr:hypothetical protein [Bdellovibrionales bacterium]